MPPIMREEGGGRGVACCGHHGLDPSGNTHVDELERPAVTCSNRYIIAYHRGESSHSLNRARTNQHANELIK